MNFVTGLILPNDLAKALVDITKKGQGQMITFVEKCLNQIQSVSIDAQSENL